MQGADAGKGDSPRPVKGDLYRSNFADINWHHKPNPVAAATKEVWEKYRAEYENEFGPFYP